MGCHTWFARPVTKEEFELFKSHAIEHAWDLYGDTDENREFNCVEMNKFYFIKNSVKNNTDYWWKHGFGTIIRNRSEDKYEHTYVINDVMYLDLSKSCNPIFADLKRYHDVFRVDNYPRKIIHSRYELRKWMRKKYFDLESWQLDKISYFFSENPGGIITFG